jgi:hypothetical protein
VQEQTLGETRNEKSFGFFRALKGGGVMRGFLLQINDNQVFRS